MIVQHQIVLVYGCQQHFQACSPSLVTRAFRDGIHWSVLVNSTQGNFTFQSRLISIQFNPCQAATLREMVSGSLKWLAIIESNKIMTKQLLRVVVLTEEVTMAWKFDGNAILPETNFPFSIQSSIHTVALSASYTIKMVVFHKAVCNCYKSVKNP